MESKCASMENKTFKKVFRKLKHCESMLKKNENMTFSKDPTCSLFIGNGGLECGFTREKLMDTFAQYGGIKKIVMLLQKSYAFVVFCSIKEASAAYANVNGQRSQNGCIFYISYVNDEDVPEEETSKNLWPDGLVLLENFVSEEEEALLLSELSLENSCNEKSVLKHRKVRHYGYEFIYGSNSIDKNQPLDRKIPDVCFTHLQKLVSFGFLPRIPDQLTVNHYLPGQGIPPHVDTHSAFEDGIVSLSLSSQVVMNFSCSQKGSTAVLLPRRSALIMLGESRYLWKHGITPKKLDVVTTKTSGHLTLLARSTRVSLTFRLIREGPCNCDYKEQCDSQGT